MIAYKFLRADGTGIFTGFRWPEPGPGGGPGEWVEATVEPCAAGVHACRAGDLPLWPNRLLYEVELDGEIVEQPMKIVGSRGRLVRRIDAWDDGAREEYVRMCAERAHELARGASPPLEDWDAVVEPSVPEGPAVVGFVAARIAEEISGLDGYHSERARQTAWLVDRLGLETAR